MRQFQKLTAQRTQILREIESLGAMRMGSVTEQTLPYKRKDGTQGQRGPYFTYTFKQENKTRGRHLRSSEEADLYKRQIENYRRYRELSAELVRVSQTLADLETSSEQDDGKKKLQELIETERKAEAERIARRLEREDALDLEGIEFYIRDRMLVAGAFVLENYLRNAAVGRPPRPRMCARNHLPRRMESTGTRVRRIRSVLGTVLFRRTRWVCPECGHVEYEADERLGVAGTGFSPGLRRLMARAGSREPFGEAAEDLLKYGGIHVDPKDVERVAEDVGREIDAWMGREGSAALLAASRGTPAGDPIPVLYIAMDGTGVPMRKSELARTRGKGEDGQARTREAKLGAVFTQTGLDDKGHPVRDPGSTTYVGAIETSVDFGNRLRAEAVRRGLARAAVVVVLCDGAKYNASIAREHFPLAVFIIDLYHALEHLSDFIRDVARLPVNGPLHEECSDLLKAGRIEEMAERMRGTLPARGPRRKKGLTAIDYFLDRKEQMRYAEFRRQGLFVGSGVIEAGCKTVIGARLKKSGMFWSEAGANAIIAARCCTCSGRFEQFWEDSVA